MGSPNEEFLSILISQYRDSSNFIAYLSAFVEQFEEIHQAAVDTINKRYIDVATGAQLDVIAELVGAGRILYGLPRAGDFGWYRTQEALGHGDDNNPGALAGPMKSDGDSDTRDYVLNDDLLRNWISARIVKNTSRCSIEDVITYFRLMTNYPDLMVEITEPAPATMHVRLHKALNVLEIALVSGIAQHIKPAGVTMIVEDDNIVIETHPIPIGG